MKKYIPLILLLLIPSMTYAASLKLSGSVKISGNIALNKNYNYVPSDLFLNFEAGAAGDVVTAAYMNSMQIGDPWTWTQMRTPLGHTHVSSSNKDNVTPIKLNNTVYGGVGTRGLKFDLDEAVTKNQNPIWEYVKAQPTSNIYDIVVSGFVTFGATTSVATTSISMDHINISGDTFVTMQVDNDDVHIETQVPPATTFKSTAIPINRTDWYYFALHYSVPNQRVELAIFNATSSALIGTSAKNTTLTGTSPITFILLQSYLIFGGGQVLFDNVSFDYTRHLWPPITITNDFSPGYVRAYQSAVNTVRLTFTSRGASMYRIERWSASSGWIVINENYDPVDNGGFIDYDTTVSDGTQYRYRITSKVGAQLSIPTYSDFITTNNSPSGSETTWKSQTTSTASFANYFSQSQQFAQKIRNTTGTIKHVSEITFYYEFTSQTNPVNVSLYENADGTGAYYGTSNEATAADGANVYTFFSPVAIPANTDFWMVAEDDFAKVQVLYAGDLYETGNGYNLYAAQAPSLNLNDTKFIIKTKD